MNQEMVLSQRSIPTRSRAYSNFIRQFNLLNSEFSFVHLKHRSAQTCLKIIHHSSACVIHDEDCEAQRLEMLFCSYLRCNGV